ncbi:MAG: GLPGLI family protein [Bacteroidota bacterium]
MKKTLITTIFLLSVIFTQAQISGSIEYGVEHRGLHVDSTKFKTEEIKKQYREWDNEIKRILKDDVVFTRIEFDQDFATYKAIPNLRSEEVEFFMALLSRDFLYDRQQQKLFDIENDERDKTVYVEYEKNPKTNFNYYIEWELKEEYREILGFKCQKAVAKNVDYSQSDALHYPIAWFTPEIPLSFGPRGFNGLPGLILGLETRGRYYYAKEIEIDEDYTPIFEEEPELLTKEEYDKNHKR